MSPLYSSGTQQQLRLLSLSTSATQTTLSLWWPLLESTGGREQPFFRPPGTMKCSSVYDENDCYYMTTVGPQSLSAAVLSPTSVHLTWVAPCHTRQYHIYYRGTCGTYINKSSLETDRQEHKFDELQEGINYTFTVNQSGFSGGRVFSTSPVYARTFTAGTIIYKCTCLLST